MNNIKDFLVTIVEKIKKYRSIYETNEMAVREQIVNPILKSLGWDTENPEEVRPNQQTDEGVPDYTLIKSGKKIMLIEAKSLNTDIEKSEVIRQLGKYSYNEGTKYGVLTNGSLWILIRSFEEGKSPNERLVWSIDLENDELSLICRKLMTISKSCIEDIEKLIKKVQILDEIWSSLLNTPEEMVKGLIPVVKSLISQGYPVYEIEDVEIEDVLKERIKEFTSIPTELETTSDEYFQQQDSTLRKMQIKGEEYILNNSFEILVNTANWLIKNGKLKPTDYPIVLGRGKRYLINKEPKHPNVVEFRAKKHLSNGLWIETHYSTAQSIINARRLLERFSYSPEILIIK